MVGGVTVLVFRCGVAVITVPLAYLFALCSTSHLLDPFKSFCGVEYHYLPLTPLLLCYRVLHWFYLFGNQGLLRSLLTESIYGYGGLVLGEVIYTFPHALMILLRIIHV